MNILRESMVRIAWPPWTIRFWIEGHPISGHELATAIKVANGMPRRNTLSVALELIKLDRVNAVEVLDTNGNGDVLYKDWP